MNTAIPQCPYFGNCGGCSSQDIPYDDQIAAKIKIVSQATGTRDIKVFTGDQYEYRNRLDMAFHPGGLGFRQKGKWWSIVDVERCAIANPKINALISEIHENFTGVDSFHSKQKIGTYRYALIRASRLESAISLVLNPESERLDEARSKIRDYALTCSADHLIIAYVKPNSSVSISEEYEVIKGSDMMKERYLDYTFRFSIQGFFQTNSELSETMHSYCKEILSRYAQRDSTLLDLYGGVGTFAIINANGFKEVFTVENFGGCVEAAKENISLNNVGNVSAHLLDARYVERLPLGTPLVAIVDPPRSGMHPDALRALRRLSPEAILYVSCNPLKLADELPQLTNYRLESAALFDFFPNTPNCEAVLELKKEGAPH